MAFKSKIILLRIQLKAFSLIELSIVLVIMGVLMGAVFKGQDLLDVAKIRSVVNDFQHIKIAISTYRDTYGSYPGDDPHAHERFGSTIRSGDGNNIINTTDEQAHVWIHLNKAGDIESPEPPESKFGGNYTIVYQPTESMPGHWIRLSKNNGEGLLTPKQAQKLMTKVDEGTAARNPNDGLLRITNGSNTVSESCLQGVNLNMNTRNQVCIVYMKM